MDEPLAPLIALTISALLARRDAWASICPSEVARQLKPQEWRALMPQVREVAARLAAQGQLEVTQRGTVLSPHEPWRGAIRFRRPSAQ